MEYQVRFASRPAGSLCANIFKAAEKGVLVHAAGRIPVAKE